MVPKFSEGEVGIDYIVALRYRISEMGVSGTGQEVNIDVQSFVV
jgi:hypothetical protein